MTAPRRLPPFCEVSGSGLNKLVLWLEEEKIRLMEKRDRVRTRRATRSWRPCAKFSGWIHGRSHRPTDRTKLGYVGI